jgi:hypothetical protein
MAAGATVNTRIARAAPSNAARCDIAVHVEDGVVDLDATISARAAVSGTYEFVTRKASDAGSSESAQSGRFSLRAGETKSVARAAVSVEDRRDVDARLVIAWDRGKVTCVAR